VEHLRTFLHTLAHRFMFNDFLLGVAAYLVVIHILCGIERSALFKKESGTGQPCLLLALHKVAKLAISKYFISVSFEVNKNWSGSFYQTDKKKVNFLAWEFLCTIVVVTKSGAS